MGNYYRVKAEVDLGKIHRNLENIRKKVSRGTKLMAVVKADGYGHGAVETAEAIYDIADAYAVAVYEEGIELREAGIKKPVLLLGYTSPEVYEVILEYGLTPAVFTYKSADLLNETARKTGKTAVIHIAVDTGMSRIGFIPDEKSIEEIVKISQLSNIVIEGIFTHFAKADYSDKTFALNQKLLFDKFYKDLKKAGIIIPIRHVSNSAAIMEMNCDYEMVRCGIITYGLYPSGEMNRNQLEIYPAMELKTHVSHIKTVPAGVGIGYGGTFVTDRASVIATVPVGYADGYPYALANRGYVLIHGVRAPIAGRICMDQFMVDVTGIENVNTGDEVVLFGSQGSGHISVEEISSLGASFNYEFVCGISKRVPRVYIGY